MQANEESRLFFGAEIEAPWPHNYPQGRLIDESSRHLTLAFLGSCNLSQLQQKLSSFSIPSFKIGPIGKSDRLIFLPTKQPRVVALHVDWITGKEALFNFQKRLLAWLEEQGYTVDKRELLSHVSIARAPFDFKQWEENFSYSLPMMIKGIHLYESMGNLTYLSRWHLPLIPAFEEFEHTADIAFHIHGENIQQLYLHAVCALCFKYPEMLHFVDFDKKPMQLESVVEILNELIGKTDAEIGCPFKAVSFHGELKKNKDLILNWEMIVDV